MKEKKDKGVDTPEALDAASSQEEKKKEVKKTAKKDGAGKKDGKKPCCSRRKKVVLAVFGIIISLFLILGISAAIGIYVVPNAEDWLVEHNFKQVTDENGQVITEGSREVVTESNWVIDVVEQSKKGVVSIALSEVSLDPESGTVEDSVNIGTGFVIDESGLILTNQHVVSDQSAEYVVMS